MLAVTPDQQKLITILEPHGPLTEADFQSAAAAIDPMIERHGCLNGLVIHTGSFPSWESFAALCSHLRFVRDHHAHIACVALATNSPVGNLVEHIASHLEKAEIHAFAFDEQEKARAWAQGDAAA